MGGTVCRCGKLTVNWRNSLSLSLLEVGNSGLEFPTATSISYKFPLRQYTDVTDCVVAPCHCSVLILTVPCRSVVPCPMTLFLCMNTHSHTHTTTRLTHSQTFDMHDSSLQRGRETERARQKTHEGERNLSLPLSILRNLSLSLSLSLSSLSLSHYLSIFHAP